MLCLMCSSASRFSYGMVSRVKQWHVMFKIEAMRHEALTQAWAY